MNDGEEQQIEKEKKLNDFYEITHLLRLVYDLMAKLLHYSSNTFTQTRKKEK